MCFLYRQSISIVYESKFKYIYRYFIKIDRCFCGILQSLPLRKCGLKFPKASGISILSTVTSLAEVWIEIAYKVGREVHFNVTSLAEVWIEILKRSTDRRWSLVTSLAEVWIEIEDEALEELERIVTSLAEVWIEIDATKASSSQNPSLPLRKCGLKFEAWGWPYEYISHFPCGSVD